MDSSGYRFKIGDKVVWTDNTRPELMGKIGLVTREEYQLDPSDSPRLDIAWQPSSTRTPLGISWFSYRFSLVEAIPNQFTKSRIQLILEEKAQK